MFKHVSAAFKTSTAVAGLMLLSSLGAVPGVHTPVAGAAEESMVLGDRGGPSPGSSDHHDDGSYQDDSYTDETDTGGGPEPCPAVDGEVGLSDEEQELLDLVAEYRADHDLEPLSLSLQRSATFHSADMAEQGIG